MPKRINTGPHEKIRKKMVSEYQGKASVDELLAKYDLYPIKLIM